MSKHKGKVSSPGKITSSNSQKSQAGSTSLIRNSVALLVALISIAIGWQWWQYSNLVRIKTPFRGPKLVESQADGNVPGDRFWGTYRSNLYFGMRTKSPDSLLFGLMWFPQYTRDGQFRLRYLCDQNDKLPKYGWLKHDGRYFGSQEIVDEDFVMRTDFVKRPGGSHGGDWTARIEAARRPGQKHDQFLSVILATALSGNGNMEAIMEDGSLVGIDGRTTQLGHFRLRFKVMRGKVMLKTSLIKHEDNVYMTQETVMQHLQYQQIKSSKHKDLRLLGLEGDIHHENDGKSPNVMMSHLVFEMPFTIEIIFESSSNKGERQATLSGRVFDAAFAEHSLRFDERFAAMINPESRNLTTAEIGFAKAALSNLVGGIGYFHGESIVQSSSHVEPTLYWPAALYTAVPSRSFFPRGFLWDEGFHQLIVAQWDTSITLDVLSHWLDLLNVDGWIPREQILGYEARQRVPAEFVVQHSENANPPTLFLAIDAILQRESQHNGQFSNATLDFLRRAFPRLSTWYQWFNTTQLGPVPFTYRWKGRDAKTDRELNPKTLTSGLDDYPRASHPTDDERHVDLRCWMALASKVMATIVDAIGHRDDRYHATYLTLSDNALLNQLHWSKKLNRYADYGNHTKFAKLEKRRETEESPVKVVRVVRSKTGPQLNHVPVYGYVTLFPFLLHILEPSSPQLLVILTDLRRRDLLWTDFGLRSLAKNDRLYMERNTEHDAPYWRGPIWINMNYLAVRALHHYAKTGGPHQQLAAEIYTELRENLMKNIFTQYQSSGYLWEQYNDVTGKGQGSHPFSGWTALVTLIIGEIY